MRRNNRRATTITWLTAITLCALLGLSLAVSQRLSAAVTAPSPPVGDHDAAVSREQIDYRPVNPHPQPFSRAREKGFPTAPVDNAANAPSPPMGEKAGMRGSIAPALLKQLLAHPTAPMRCIVQLDGAPSAHQLDAAARRGDLASFLQARLDAHLAALQPTLDAQRADGQLDAVEPLWIAHALAIQAMPDAILALAWHPAVRLILPDRQHRLEAAPLRATGTAPTDVPWHIPAIGADQVWSRLGLDGKGIVVATLDSGADAQHPALAQAYRGHNGKGLPTHAGNWFCATNEAYAYPGDGLGHGTHVLGSIVGADGLGVAPGAQWIAAKVFNNDGYTYDSWLHAGFQWILAPAGSPGLAPDVVNCSWGSSDEQDRTFEPDLQALKAAGIAVLFAAGNDGPEAGSIQSPASLPGVLAVGASDPWGDVASFSGRGPSPWDEIKPLLIAPGVDIRSSVPGGGQALGDGTSMATPLVAGTAALLRQANPDLSPAQLTRLLTQTARSDLPPNHDSGHGLLDAYSAALAATTAGQITGIVRDEAGRPLANATITAEAVADGRIATARSDAAGRYQMDLRPGHYQLGASHFGHEAARVRQTVAAQTAHAIDWRLAALPVGALIGRVTDAESEAPVAATLTVHLPDNAGVITTTSRADTGLYALALPGGVYAVTVERLGYHIAQATASIQADESAVLDWGLTPAPTILLVDSGAWYYNSHAAYYAQALADLHYAHHTWTIRDPRVDLPEATDLAAYDVVLWSAPEDAPGLVGAAQAVGDYMLGGGKLWISGQDVAFWDGGGAMLAYQPYFTGLLKARFLEDDSGRDPIHGLDDDILGGGYWPLNGPDSARNQFYPDVIAPDDPEYAVPIAAHGRGATAALRIGGCLPYRAILLTAGLEGMGDRVSRAALLAHSIHWLTAPPPATDIHWLVSPQPGLPDRDRLIAHTITIKNTGALTDTFKLALQPGQWPATLNDAAGQPLAQRQTLGPCQNLQVAVQVTAPDQAPSHATDLTRLHIHSERAGQRLASIELANKLPASILLVDDDKWEHVEASYEAALAHRGLTYDHWEIGWNQGDGRGAPPLEVLRQYPLVIWFTGSNWADPLTPNKAAPLSAYLADGGRMLLASQDWFYANGVTDLARDHFGVLTYTEDLTATWAAGTAESPLGIDWGPYPLGQGASNWSDALVPTAQAHAALVGDHGLPCALTWSDDDPLGSRTAFFALPLEALPATSPVWDGLLRWLGPLSNVRTAIAPRAPAPSQTVQLTWTAANRHADPATLRMTDTLPVGLEPLQRPDALVYDPTTRALTWHATLAPLASVTLTMTGRIQEHIAPGTPLVNDVLWHHDSGWRHAERQPLIIGGPDLSASAVTAHPHHGAPGMWIDYAIHVENRGARATRAYLSSVPPTGTRLEKGTAQASDGQLFPQARYLTWSGDLAPGQPLTITYRAWLGHTLGAQLVNRVVISDDLGVHTLAAARLPVVQTESVHLPLLR